MDDRRQFTRIVFSSDANLALEHSVKSPVRIIDLSLNGALIKTPTLKAKPGDRGRLFIELSSYGSINMEVIVTHFKDGEAGLLCESFDIESATHLQRLIALRIENQQRLSQNPLDQYQSSFYPTHYITGFSPR